MTVIIQSYYVALSSGLTLKGQFHALRVHLCCHNLVKMLHGWMDFVTGV